MIGKAVLPVRFYILPGCQELVGLLRLDERSSETLLRMLQRRETLGSTGVGRGIAIPHCRSLVVSHLRLGYGHKREAVDFQAIDGQPVSDFFLIVAPPTEVSNQYLPVLGKIAQFVAVAVETHPLLEVDAAVVPGLFHLYGHPGMPAQEGIEDERRPSGT